MVALMVWTVTLYGAAAANSLQPRNKMVENIDATAKPEASAADKEAAEMKKKVEAISMAAPIIHTNESEFITINYKDADLQNVLRMIARASGINLVIDPAVKGKQVTLEMSHVHWTEALDEVLKCTQCTMVRDSLHVVRVLPEGAAKGEPASYDIIQLDYLAASEVAPQVQSLLSKDVGSCMVNAGANALVVGDTPVKLSQIRALVERLDRPTPQIVIDARFVEISDNPKKTQGVDWTPIGDYQILLQKMLMDFTRNVSYDRSSTGSKEVGLYKLPLPSGNPTGKAASWTITQSEATSYELAPQQFQLAFSMLMNDARSKLISNPRLQTMDNKMAKIQVAEIKYKPKYTFNPQTGSYGINDLEEIPIGITLEVTPSVNPKGEVKLKVMPEVSALTGVQTLQGVDIPTVAKRKIETEVTLKDSHTVAIGGMMRDDWVSTEKSVPYLCDMPYIGKSCFTWSNREKTTINLIIFITPTVIKDGDANKIYRHNLDVMHTDENGEFIDQVKNFPSDDMLKMREKLLISGLEEKTADTTGGK